MLCSEVPVRGAHLLSVEGPLPLRNAEGQAVPDIAGSLRWAGPGQTDRPTHQTWVSAKLSHCQSLFSSSSSSRERSLPLRLARMGDSGQQRGVAPPPTLSPSPHGQQACACTLPGSTVGLWGCCCSFAPWLPGNGECKRQSSGSSGAEC